MDQDFIVTARDLRSVGVCIHDGARPFCQRNGINFRDFMRNGIHASELLETDDAMAIKVVRTLEARGGK